MNDYQFYLSMGICPHCQKRKIVPGRHACSECLAKSRKREAKSRDRKLAENPDPDYIERDNENRRNAVRRYRERHRAAGLCIFCNNKAVPGLQMCEKHRKITADYNRRRYHERKKPSRQHLDPPILDRNYKVDVGKLFALYNAGWKICDIAAELKVTESTVYRWLHKAKEAQDADIS